VEALCVIEAGRFGPASLDTFLIACHGGILLQHGIMAMSADTEAMLLNLSFPHWRT